jgi:hypothetical protein
MIMTKATVTQAARATTGEQPAAKPKGAKPTHRLTRVVDTNGEKSYQEIGALWPHKDNKGFSVKLNAAVNLGDNLMIRTADRGAS